MEQMTIFDYMQQIRQEETGQQGGKTLSDYAFLYTGTSTGKNSGVHFMMTMEDARKWCESELSHGVMHGNRWAYFFTSVQNFISCHWGTHKPTLDFRKQKDNGKWDEKIESLGLKKFGFEEIRDILTPFGVEVLL